MFREKVQNNEKTQTHAIDAVLAGSNALITLKAIPLPFSSVPFEIRSVLFFVRIKNFERNSYEHVVEFED